MLDAQMRHCYKIASQVADGGTDVSHDLNVFTFTCAILENATKKHRATKKITSVIL